MTGSQLIEAQALSRYYRRTQPQLARWQAPATAALDAALQQVRADPESHTALAWQAPLTKLLDEASNNRPLSEALRVARHAMQCSLIEHDCATATNRGAALDASTAVLSSFAELACERASKAACDELATRHPAPESPSLLIAGMGKLGAGELNASSDIDLVYLHAEEGETADMSHHEWFSRASRRCSQLLNDVTEHGFVFRVDTRLRPNGDEGPSVCSFEMLEQYFTAQGRPWERFAWLRARLLGEAGHSVIAEREWKNTVQPFVYRRYADFGMVESLRALHAQIRADAKARALRNPAASGDVKRSRGGIRELEFFVQLLQLVRGGVAPELRERHTRRALKVLSAAGIIDKPRADALSSAYTFLRALENRIQYLDDAQTHTLPTDDQDLAHLAAAMNASSTCELLCTLDEHREQVASAFDSLLLTLGAESNARSANTGCTNCGPSNVKTAQNTDTGNMTSSVANNIIRNNHDTNNSINENHIQAAITHLKEHPSVMRLTPQAQTRLTRVVSRSVVALREAAAQGKANDDYSVAAFEAWLDWLAAHASRTNYLAFFDEHPQAAERLMRLFTVCNFAAQYVRRFPGVVDELLSAQATERFDADAYKQMLRTRLAAIEKQQAGDVEPLLDALRRAHQLETFRLVLRDTELQPPVEAMSDDITALADATLEVSLQACWRSFALKQGDEAPQFAVIGYGKLGSKELGYASDLDLVLIYDDSANDEAGTRYTHFAKRWINWLTTHTGSGRLFDIDTRLRPNGNAGLLVTSLSAFEQYQLGRGGNTAWTWEHQALTKARFVAGSAKIGGAFETIRSKVLQSSRNAQALATEIRAMRQKMHAAHPPREGFFDVKHDSGGLVDAEFVVQYLVLSQSQAHPELTRNSGTIALLGTCAALGLLPRDMAALAQNAYRDLRVEQHRLKLAGNEYAQVAEPAFAAQRNAIRDLWQQVFDSTSTRDAS